MYIYIYIYMYIHKDPHPFCSKDMGGSPGVAVHTTISEETEP